MCERVKRCLFPSVLVSHALSLSPCRMSSLAGSNGGSCVSCVAGKYKTAGGSAACTDCPANTFSPVAAATTPSGCTTCPAQSSSVAGAPCHRWRDVETFFPPRALFHFPFFSVRMSVRPCLSQLWWPLALCRSTLSHTLTRPYANHATHTCFQLGLCTRFDVAVRCYSREYACFLRANDAASAPHLVRAQASDARGHGHRKRRPRRLQVHRRLHRPRRRRVHRLLAWHQQGSSRLRTLRAVPVRQVLAGCGSLLQQLPLELHLAGRQRRPHRLWLQCGIHR